MDCELRTASTVEIIAVGRELLLGEVLDTNTHWLCQQIARRGGQVRRAVLVDDDPAAIGRELLAALDRETALILMGGGLGPTEDDRTLAALAQALHRPLVEDEEALAMVRATYTELAARGYVSEAELTPSRRKMALLPQGARPLANPVGAAPAVLLEIGCSAVAVLPGVPAELKAVFSTSLQPVLARLFPLQAHHEQTLAVQCGDESRLAPILQAVAAAHPRVYVKSLASSFGPDQWLRIILSAQAQDQVDAALLDLQQRLAEAHIPSLSE